MTARQARLLKDPEDLRVSDLTPAVPLLGIPWDWSTAGRPGARFAPSVIRQELYSLRPLSHDLGALKVGFDDLGDVDVVGGDPDETSKRATTAARAAMEASSSRSVPAVFLGGDHSVTGWVSKPFVEAGASILVLDAHYDLRKVSEGVTSGSWLRELLESHRDVEVMVVGASDYLNPPYAPARAAELGLKVVTRSRLLRDPQGALSEVRDFVRGRKVYLSIDMDHLDQAFAPGVNSPNPAGMTPYETLAVLDSLREASAVVAVDVTEVAPPYDVGGQTARLAAYLLLRAVHVSFSAGGRH